MLNWKKLNLPKFDWWMLLVVILLVAISISVLISVEYDVNSFWASNYFKQIIYFGVGLVVLMLMSFFDYRWLRNYAFLLYLFSLIILVAVLLFGSTIRGTTGWFKLGPFSFQPVELVKVFYIIFLSYYLSQFKDQLRQLKSFALIILATFILIGLVLLQPDLGSALIFIVILISGLFLAPTRRIHLIGFIGVLLIAMVASWFLVLADYQKDRILTFIQPQRDPLGAGYNLTQSLYAIGSGKVWGGGLGLGTQSQLNFLPEKENDFIFAALAESLGFVGALLLIGLYGFLFYRILRLARGSPDSFTGYLVLGILVYLFAQLVINIGMNIGLAPITGLPLPFFSAGGSSLLTLMFALGILESIALRRV